MGNKGNKTILGIVPGTKQIGIAIMSGPVLREWRIKNFPGEFSTAKEKKIMKMLTKIIELYRVTDIALKIPRFDNSENLNNVVFKINELAEQKKISMYFYSTPELADIYGAESQKELLNIISQRNSSLLREFTKEENNKRKKYYDKMFMAVGMVKALHRNFDVGPQ
jgi:hypothetical protein